MSEITTRSEETLENRCPACTASISFNPKIGKWKCDYCGSEFTLEEMQKHSNNASGKDKNIKRENQKNVDSQEYVTYRCESCGAEIVADEQTSATFCVYCGATAILKSKLSGQFAPELIIPFKKTKEDAIVAFKNLTKKRPLVPKSFVAEENIEKIRGVYIPFWLYDVKTSGDVHMVGTIATSWVRGNKMYIKTDRYKVVRGGTLEFNNIPVDGSKRFDNDIMSSLEPFDFREMIEYNHAYLSGFYAEKYDEDVDELYQRAAERAKNSALEGLKQDTSKYETVIIESNTLKNTEEKRTYALLPVWMVNIKYKDKMHIFAMNGQTGEFIGDIPLDKKKTVIYSILIFLISMLVIIIVSYFIRGV